jgi:hypothetical protein
MSKFTKVIICILFFNLTLGLLHVWQNVGFENIGIRFFSAGKKTEIETDKFKVGFLPVT